jgi:hypothetical protein
MYKAHAITSISHKFSFILSLQRNRKDADTGSHSGMSGYVPHGTPHYQLVILFLRCHRSKS